MTNPALLHPSALPEAPPRLNIHSNALSALQRLMPEMPIQPAARRRRFPDFDSIRATCTPCARSSTYLCNPQCTNIQTGPVDGGRSPLLAEWPAWQERSFRFEEDVQWGLDDGTRERWQGRPDMLERIEQGLRHASERKAIPELEEDRIAGMVGAELARLRDPAPHMHSPDSGSGRNRCSRASG